MKKHLLVLALGVSLCPFYARAQYNNYPPPQQNPATGQYGMTPQAGDVNITSGPNVSNVSGNTATLSWTTDKTAANRVEYRADGENSWHSAYEPGGSTNHSVTLSNLTPGRNYQFRIMTRDNQVRTAGNFSTAGNGGYYNNNGAYNNGGSNSTYNNGAVGSRGDRDRDNDANRGDHDRDNGSGYRTDRDNDANRGDHDRDNNATRTDRDNDANHMDRDHDQNRANADNDRDHDKNKNHKDKDKNKNKDKDNDKDKDHDKDNSNPR